VSDIVPRRRVLVASAVALPLLLGSAGCRSSDAFTGPDPLAGRPPLGHDVLTLQAVIAAEENMIDLYRMAISGDSPIRGASRARTLRSLLAQHEQHLTRLKARLVVPPAWPRGSGGNGFPPGSGGSRGVVPPGEQGYGLTGMRERAELLGGTLDAAPTGTGFRVLLRVPAGDGA
jgi:hypothetical protein